MPAQQRVASKDDVLPGGSKGIVLNGQEVALFNVDGSYSAIDNTCPHRGGPLSDGSLNGRTVTCPWHAWEFDVTTGSCLNNPAARVRAYPVEIQGNDLFVTL